MGLGVIRIKVYTVLALEEILGQREFEISIRCRSTVKDLIFWMIKTIGDKRSSLFYPESNRLLPQIRLMVNGRDIEFLNGMETVLQDGDEFMMIPFVAGG
jgi:molybdopterin synthase sulfur carrier subunit